MSTANIVQTVPRRLGAIVPQSVAYAFIAPALLCLFALLVLPILVVFALSFTDYELGDIASSFVGIANYQAAMSSPEFVNSFRNTVYYALLTVPFSVISGLFLAIVLFNLKRGRRLYQLIFFLPVTTTLIPMATVWRYLLHGQIGPLAQLFSALGLPQVEFFSDPQLAMPALAVISIWHGAGFNMVLFIAGLTAIPDELYDAASVDGVDHPLERLFTIVLPLLGPTLLFVLVMSLISAFRMFDLVGALTRGDPYGATDVILYTTYLEGYSYFRMGSASAMTMIFLVIILLLSIVQSRTIEQRVHYQ